MLLSAQELANRLGSSKNSARDKNLAKGIPIGKRTLEDLDRNDIPSGPDLYIRNTRGGRREEDHKVLPPELQIPAMTLARLGGNQREIAQTFEMSDSTLSKLKNYGSGDAEVNETVDVAVSGVREVLVNKMKEALDHLTPDKLANAKAGELANVARSMSTILEDTRDKSKDNKSSNIKIVIHGVERVDVEKYEVIEVGA